MKAITGLIGRDDLIETVAREARKGHHLLLTGPVGVGSPPCWRPRWTGCWRGKT